MLRFHHQMCQIPFLVFVLTHDKTGLVFFINIGSAKRGQRLQVYKDQT